jgi:hypothetical protein
VIRQRNCEYRRVSPQVAGPTVKIADVLSQAVV